jgi:hypothetical protein
MKMLNEPGNSLIGSVLSHEKRIGKHSNLPFTRCADRVANCVLDGSMPSHLVASTSLPRRPRPPASSTMRLTGSFRLTSRFWNSLGESERGRVSQRRQRFAPVESTEGTDSGANLEPFLFRVLKRDCLLDGFPNGRFRGVIRARELKRSPRFRVACDLAEADFPCKARGSWNSTNATLLIRCSLYLHVTASFTLAE